MNKEDRFIEIFIVRHAETIENATGRFIGSSDVPLSEKGLRQAARAAEYLNRSDGRQDIIFTSPYQRAMQTAGQIKDKCDGKIVSDNRLVEMDYGEWEMLSRDEIKEMNPELYKGYETDPYRFYPAKGESPKDIEKRIGSFWNEVVCNLPQGIRKATIVTHKTTGRILFNLLMGNRFCNFREIKMDNCSIAKIILNRNSYQIDEMNLNYYRNNIE